jgi:hypothetical protein
MARTMNAGAITNAGKHDRSSSVFQFESGIAGMSLENAEVQAHMVIAAATHWRSDTFSVRGA